MNSRIENTKALKPWLTFIFAIPPGIAVALHAYLGSFTRLLADDYCTVYFANRLGILRTAWYWYLNFAGVFARSVINKILLMVGVDNISVVVPGVLILWIAATAWALFLLLSKEFPSKPRGWISLAWSITFIYTVLLLSPQPTQSLYWWGGFSAYTAPLILGTFYLAMFLIFRGREWKKVILLLWSIVSFLMAFGLGGISESFSPTFLMVIFFTFGWTLRVKKTDKDRPEIWFLGAGLLGSILALIIMISAPGNAIRMSYFNPPTFLGILQISIDGYLDYLRALLMTPQKFSGILGMFFGSMLVGIITANKNQPKNWAPSILLALGIFFAFLSFPPAAYGTSEPPPNRVLVISSFMLTVGLMISGYTGGMWFSTNALSNFTNAKTALLITATIAPLCFSSWITSQDLFESRGVFIEFAEKWDRTDLQIRQAKEKGGESVTIPALDNWAGLERPNENKKYWPNKCYSAYYGIQIYGPPYDWTDSP
ncbi:MAG: hypothetical protein IT313_04630 [Anaerolineales bacterium]|nr:hypothetical protein [Anaerolineales bacterium]